MFAENWTSATRSFPGQMVTVMRHLRIFSLILIIASQLGDATNNDTSSDDGAAGQIGLVPSDTVDFNKIRVNGTIFCGNEVPYPSAFVRLYTHRQYIDSKSISTKHIIDGTRTATDGTFEVFGERNTSQDVSETFEPVIVIYHQCGQLERMNATHRRFAVRVPQQYVNSEQTFTIGAINLVPHFPGQVEGITYYRYNIPLKICGELFCEDKTAVKKVRLYAFQQQSLTSFLSEVVAQDGFFTIDTAQAPVTEPNIVILHQCGLSSSEVRQRLYRKFTVWIPYFYYNEGRRGLKPFKIGTYNLELEFPGETKEHMQDD